jgi:hypothetical protein
MDDELLARLAEPFDPSEVKFKAQVVRASRALAVAYVDARVVEDRLDRVFGPGGWQDAYTVLPNGSVMCVLRVKIGGEWIEKSDVGSVSEQPDEGDRLKSAFSDALKRAAVKLGIGRYLYRLPQQWVDYDSNTRQIKQTPNLPDWARPKARKPAEKNGQPDRISADEAKALKTYLSECGAKWALVSRHYGVERLTDFTPADFADCKKKLADGFPAFFPAPAEVGDAHEG